MATNIRLKYSSVSGKTPTLSDLSLRELAANTTDGKLFLRKGNGSESDEIIDITAPAFSSITSKPTTLSGYGITDALSNSSTSTQSGYFGNIFLYDDSAPSHYLGITNSANLTADRTLSVDVNDADRTITLSGNLSLANNFTTSGNFAVTLTATATTSVTLPTSGTLATTGNLSQFAATTSAQLAGVISDETGTGNLVFNTSPSFTTAVNTGSTSFNVFNTTATTINAFGAATTLSIGAGTGTTTVNNNLSVTGTATATSFSGSGSNLTGIVTSIIAGSGISIDQSTGAVTITSAGGGNSTVTISDTAPVSPSSGDLWWKSDEGKLKIYYNDGDSSQWVDTFVSQKGDSGTIQIGTVTTGNPGSSASITNVGTLSDAILNFSIPRGDSGLAAAISVGSVTTGAPGTSASVINSGTSSNAVLDFTIPAGADGAGVTTAQAIAYSIAL